jgi:hypothetical protein
LRTILVSWVAPDGLRKLLDGQDTFFGEIPSSESTYRIYLMVGAFGRDQIDQVKSLGFGVIHYRFDAWRPIRAIRVLGRLMSSEPPSPKLWAAACSRDFVDGDIIWRAIKKRFSGLLHKVETVVVPYEGQPFQQRIFIECQKYRNIRTVGYLHSGMPAFPGYMVHRPGAPHVLLIHGPAYKDGLMALGWSEDSLQIIPTLRLARRNRADIEGRIYIPYAAPTYESVGPELAVVLQNLETRLRMPRVQLHPDRTNSPEHKELKTQLEQLLGSMSDKFTDDAQASLTIYIGYTSVMFEAMEGGLEVVQICGEPAVECFAPDIWRSLKIEKISEKCYRYSLPTKGSLIRYPEDKQSILDVLQAVSTPLRQPDSTFTVATPC